MSGLRVLVVGVGGISCPATRVLVRSGVTSMTLIDDDVVDVGNLQRQVLFHDEHLGMPKAEVASAALRRERDDATIDAIVARLVPENALELVRAHDVVLEGADNFATKFLAFDAARLAGRPIVQAGAVRWTGWVMASPANDGPCLRCVFEDMPPGDADTCAISGVVGPVVGVIGALAAARVLQVLRSDPAAIGSILHYDALPGKLRRSRVAPRPGCPSCAGAISDLSRDRYAPSCAA